MPVHTADFSPPLTALNASGADVTDASTEVVPANAGRTKVEIQNAGTVRVWLGIGTPAVVGEGKFIDEGDEWWEYTTEAVEALHEDTGQTHRVAVQEWGA